MVMPYHLHMPSYFLETFTEYPSSKYLTEALTLVSGKSPKEWIIHYTLQEIYALLENPSISIQEIVQRTRFANLATLRRFFKRHTGTSLLQYRKQDLYKNNQ